jgi:hypothetical protein
MKSKFLTTWYGSLIKNFLSMVIGIYIANGYNLFEMDLTALKTLISAGIGASLPVLLNALNTNYKGYGKQEPLKPIKRK